MISTSVHVFIYNKLDQGNKYFVKQQLRLYNSIKLELQPKESPKEWARSRSRLMQKKCILQLCILPYCQDGVPVSYSQLQTMKWWNISIKVRAFFMLHQRTKHPIDSFWALPTITDLAFLATLRAIFI